MGEVRMAYLDQAGNATRKQRSIAHLYLVVQLVVIGALLTSIGAMSQTTTTPSVTLWRLDCGSFNTLPNVFSDTEAYPMQHRTFTDSCYLVRHGKELLLFDTGLSTGLRGPLDPAKPLSMMAGTSITEQLARLGIKSSQITIIALSHNHSDHTGQAADFPQAKLLIGRQDIDALRNAPVPFFTEPDQLLPWLSGKSTLDAVDGDRDVFGDGTVVFLALPGHTRGHHGLLVRLQDSQPLLITGDAVHFRSQLRGEVPPTNASRADTLASIDRLQRLAANLHAVLVIPHDPDDVSKIAIFPAFAH